MGLGRAWILVCVAGVGYAASRSLDVREAASASDWDSREVLEIEPDVVRTGPLANFVDSTCSTGVVDPLSRQIADEMLCIVPGAFERLDATPRLRFQSRAVLPYLDSAAADSLRRAASEEPLVINSGLRTVAQQFLLHEWADRGRCGISRAATPGNSNHETGRAVDVTATPAQRRALRRQGWIDRVRRDPVHFEHRKSPDQRGLGIRAFQRLWNRNHPGDRIDEDGVWGRATRARILRSPAQGFERGPACELGRRASTL